MNRKQRRVTLKRGPPADARGSDSNGDQVKQLFFEAAECARARKLDDAVRIYKRVLLLKPDHAEACNNLGSVLQAQGKPAEASIYFARALALMPQLLKQYAGICSTLIALLPPLGEALRRQAAAWPQQLSEQELFGDAGIAAIAANPLLQRLMQSIPVQDVAFERLLTSLRASLLKSTTRGQTMSDPVLQFACALADQCFINEYVFATTPEEDAQAGQITHVIEHSIAARGAITPSALVWLAMSRPLHTLASAHALLDRHVPPVVDRILTLQLRQPAQERELRDSIQRLTPIEDEVSLRVQKQYEESPYPRWVDVA